MTAAGRLFNDCVATRRVADRRAANRDDAARRRARTDGDGLRFLGFFAAGLFARRQLVTRFPLPLKLVSLRAQFHIGAIAPTLDKRVALDCGGLSVVVFFADAVFVGTLFGLQGAALRRFLVIFPQSF
jgi:hypothetical protein